jgi:hypothetical protein
VLGFNSHYKPHLPQPLCLLAIVIHCTNLRRLGKRWQMCNQSTRLISATLQSCCHARTHPQSWDPKP